MSHSCGHAGVHDMTMQHTHRTTVTATNARPLKYRKGISLLLGIVGAGVVGSVVAALLQLLIQIKGIETAFLASVPCFPILLICFDRHRMAARRRFSFALGIALGLAGGFWCGAHVVQYFTGTV